MRTVMIVDDESLVRVGLQSIVDWENHGYRIAGVYQNGEEAFVAVRDCPPDVLLTDIKMPVMDGFELIKRAKGLYSRLNIVILSSYNEFEYTRKAIQLGVNDFIPKYQVEADELLNILDSFNYGTSREYGELLNPVNQEKEQFLKATGSGSKSEFARNMEKFPNLKQLLYSKGSVYCWAVLRTLTREKAYQASLDKALVFTMEELFNRLKETVFLGCSRKFLHGIICFGNGSNAHKTTNEIANELYVALKEKLNIYPVIGISRTFETSSLFPALRSSAETAVQLSFYKGSGIYIHSPGTGLKGFSEMEWMNLYRKIKELVWNSDMDGLICWLDTVQEKARMRIQPEDLIQLCRTIIYRSTDLMIEKYKLDSQEIKRHFENMWPLTELPEKSYSCDILFNSTRDFIVRLKEILCQNAFNKRWINQIVDYIHGNYSSNIHLEDVSNLTNFSEGYLSRRFHEETGCSFSEYLSRVRVQKAMELYTETGLSTDEIAVKVGYNNPNYFVKVFKRITGKTVSEFKRDK